MISMWILSGEFPFENDFLFLGEKGIAVLSFLKDLLKPMVFKPWRFFGSV